MATRRGLDWIPSLISVLRQSSVDQDSSVRSVRTRENLKSWSTIDWFVDTNHSSRVVFENLKLKKDGRQIITVRRGCRNNEWIDSCEPSGWFSNWSIKSELLRTNQKAGAWGFENRIRYKWISNSRLPQSISNHWSRCWTRKSC